MTAATVTVTGLTDVGRVREANEDDYFVGTSIVAVADGMGGHLAGEVASRTALEPVRALDGTSFDEPTAALDALKAAVIEANDTVCQMADDEPSYRGMGTTLTAALVEGRRLHLAHVGDSRAYLLRGSGFAQLTDDHTLVQHLVDEGQITREEAGSHPQRSIITRAIGVSRDIEVDATSIELEPGDQVLLCSDGLTGVVEDDAIATELRRGDDPDATLRRLVEAANHAGGPDNITIVLVRYGDVVPGPLDDDPTIEGGAAPVRIGTREEGDASDWAGRLGNYGALTPGMAATDGDGGRRTGRSLGKVAAVLLGLAVLAGLAVVAGRFLLDRSFFVGLDDDQVVIYQGVDVDLGPVSLAQVVERTEVTVDDVATYYRPSLEAGRTATDLEDARRIVAGAPRSDGGTADDAEDADADAAVGENS